MTKADAYPLPYMNDILRKLQKVRYISTLDLSSAYHQIPLRAESHPVTAFTVPGLRLYQFTRMPYGLSYAGSTFQHMRRRDFVGLQPYTYSYLDDVIIVTEPFQEHRVWLERVLECIRAAGLAINREKSVLC